MFNRVSYGMSHKKVAQIVLTLIYSVHELTMKGKHWFFINASSQFLPNLYRFY